MPSLTQQETALRSATYKGFYTIAAIPPTVTDDRNKSFIFGSRWLCTTVGVEEEFVCVSNNPGAAVWLSTTSGGGGGGILPHVAAVDPTVNDDTGDGYVVGQLWINTASDDVFIATDVTAAASVWINLSASGGGNPPHIAAVDPTVNDDTGDGYVVGQIWVNASADSVFIATDVTAAAAVWVDVSTGGGSTTHVATADPTVNDDSGDGYVVGQLWLNTANNNVFMMRTATVAAAVWINLTKPTAANTSADADAYLTGLTVQSQLTSISNMFRGVNGYIRGIVAIGYFNLTVTAVRAIDGYNVV